MSSYQAGFGMKKPLNLMEAPILSDIKQQIADLSKVRVDSGT